ncbi:MAG: SDR family NAD(P)-dependent oxidoreductase [Anaerotignum sp.]|nr:SDR family NAD(P)-dependent oxidoreductase [Anaerotignum sp.]
MAYPFPENSIFLVTGGAGFIGSNLCAKIIAEGHEVRCFDDLSNGRRGNIAELEKSPRFHFLQGDICSREDCLRACEGVDYVLHNAALSSVAESMQNPERYRKVNVGGMENILQAAAECGVKRFVYASSAAVYGDAGKSVAVEGEEGNPLSVYAETKQENERQAKRYTQEKGLSTFGLRYFNVYGAGQYPGGGYSAVIPSFISRLLKGETATINGDGLQTRDFVYVEDIVQANLKACLAESEFAGEVFNIGGGSEISILELFREIAAALQVETEPVFGPPAKGDVRFSCADISKAKKMLGYQPAYSFGEGIVSSVEWYKKNL